MKAILYVLMLLVLVGVVSAGAETLWYDDNFTDAGPYNNRCVPSGLTLETEEIVSGNASFYVNAANQYCLNSSPQGITTGEHSNSMSLWFRATSDPTGSTGAMFGTHKTSTSTQSWYSTFNGNNNIQMRSNGGGAPTTDCLNYAANTWYHLVTVYNSTDHTTLIYIDGVPCAGGVQSSTPSMQGPMVTIGNNGFLDGGWNYGLYLDDLRYFDDLKLNQDNVTQLYEHPGVGLGQFIEEVQTVTIVSPDNGTVWNMWDEDQVIIINVSFETFEATPCYLVSEGMGTQIMDHQEGGIWQYVVRKADEYSGSLNYGDVYSYYVECTNEEEEVVNSETRTFEWSVPFVSYWDTACEAFENDLNYTVNGTLDVEINMAGWDRCELHIAPNTMESIIYNFTESYMGSVPLTLGLFEQEGYNFSYSESMLSYMDYMNCWIEDTDYRTEEATYCFSMYVSDVTPPEENVTNVTGNWSVAWQPTQRIGISYDVYFLLFWVALVAVGFAACMHWHRDYPILWIGYAVILGMFGFYLKYSLFVDAPGIYSWSSWVFAGFLWAFALVAVVVGAIGGIEQIKR